MQHLRSVLPVLAGLRVTEPAFLGRTWALTHQRLRASKDRWKIVAGPLAALQAYLMDMQVACGSLSSWKVQGVDLDPLEVFGRRFLIQDSLRSHMAARRFLRIAAQPGGQGSEHGLDFRLLHRLNKTPMPSIRKSALRAVWQGAVATGKSGGSKTCPHCGAETSLEHVLLQCPWWRGRHRPQPPEWEALKLRFPYPCLWVRGLTPSALTRGPWEKEEVSVHGALPLCRFSSEPFLWATDGSGGPSRDPRARAVSWSAVAYTVFQGKAVYQGHLSGVLPPGSSVYQGEVAAICAVLSRTTGRVRLTTDCKTAFQAASRRYPGVAWSSAYDEIHRLELTWVRSHLSEAAFRLCHPLLPDYHRQANDLADKLCVRPDLAARVRAHKTHLVFLDDLVRQVNGFLAARMCIILRSSKSDPPPWGFKTAAERKACRSAVVARPPSKRQRLLNLTRGPHLGHSFLISSNCPTNLTVRCDKCRLYIRQVLPDPRFDLVLAHPCVGMDRQDSPWLFHPSHRVENAGRVLVCRACSRQQCPSNVSTAHLLSLPCVGVRGKRSVAGRLTQVPGQSRLPFHV
jgi:hypothetical protein